MKITSNLMLFFTFSIFTILIVIYEMSASKIAHIEEEYIYNQDICENLNISSEKYIIEKSFIKNTERETPLFFIVESNNELVVCKEMVK